MPAFKNNAQKLRFIASRLEAWLMNEYASNLRAIADDIDREKSK